MSKEDLAVQVDELMATDKAQEETVHDPLTKLITEGLFIDKTLLIKEFLKDEESHKTYILRPHGFGKSTLLDIIEAMYTDMERLKGTKVYEEGFDESLPVIRIDMQKLIGAFPFPVKLDFNAKTAACVKNLKLLPSPNNKEKDDFGSALFAAFYEQIASGKQAIKPSRTTSSEHNNLERQADAERHESDVELHGAATDVTAHGSNLSESTADEPSLASGNDKHSAGAHSAADRYEEDLIASLEALSTLSAEAKSSDAKTNGDKSEASAEYDASAQDEASAQDGASRDADNGEADVYYQSIDELGRGEAKASYISTEHALKGGSFHSANQANKSSKSGKDHGAVQEMVNGPFEQQDALSDGGVALLDSINENFSYIPSQTSEKSSLFYIAHLLSRCEHRSRVLLIDNFDAPLLATAYEPALYNRRSQVMHYLFTILGTYAHVFRHIIITSTMPYESYGPGMRERNQNDLELDMKFSYSAKCAQMIGVSEEDLLSAQLSKYMSKALSYMQAIHAKYKDKDFAAMHDVARSSFRHISLSMLELFVSGPCPQSTKELASLLSSFYGNFSFDRMTRTMAAVSVINFLRHPEFGFAPYRYGAAPLDVRYAFDISGSSITDFMQVLSNIFKGEERVLLENATLPNALRPNSVIDRIVKLQRNLYRLKELKEQIIKAKGQGYKGEEIELINERLIYIRDRLNEIKKQMPTERSVSKALAAKVLPQKNASNSGGSVIYESADDRAAPDAASAQDASKAQDAAAAAKSSSQASKDSEIKSAPRHKSPFAIIDDEDELEQATENQESSPSNTNSPSNTVLAYLDEVGESIEAIEQQAAAAMANANLDVQEANALDEDHGTAATNKTNEPSDSNAHGQDAAAVPSASNNAQTSGANSAMSQDGQVAASNDAMSNASVKDDNAAQSDFSEETMGVITDELADGKIELIAPVRGRNGQNMESPEEREMMRRMPLGMTLSHMMVAFGYLTTCRYENYELLSTMPNYESYMSLKHAVLETLYAHSDYKRLPKIADNDTVFNGNLKAFLNNLRTVVHSFSYRRSDFVDSQAITACLNLYYAMNHATAPSVATGANVPFLADSVSTTAKKAADRILKDDEEIQRKLNDRLGKNKAAADTQDSTDDKSDDRSLKIELAANAKLEFYDACRQERALAKRAANGDANAAKMLEAAREDIKAYDQRAQEVIAAVDNPKIKASDIVLLSVQRAKQNANAAKQDDEALEQDGKFKSNAANSKRAMAHAAIGNEHSSLSKDEEILLAKEQEAQAFADVIKAGHEVVCPVVFELDELSDGKAEESLDKDSDDKSDMPVGYMSKQELLAEEQEIKELLKKAYSNLKDSGKVNVSDEQDAILERLISSIGIAFDTRNAEEERSDIAGASRVVDVPEDGVIETFKDRAQERVRSAKQKSKKARSADDAIQLDALEQLGELVASGDNFAEYVSEHDKFVKASSFTLEQFNKSHDEYQKVLKVEEELHGKSDNEKEAIVEEGVNTINELGNIIVSRLKRGADYAKDIDTPAVDNNTAAQSANSTEEQAADSNSNSNNNSNAKQPQGQHAHQHEHAHQQQRQHEQTASKGVAAAHMEISADPDMQDTSLRASASTMSEEDDAKERDEAHEAHMRSIAMSEKIVNLREAITVLKDFAEQISASRKNDGVAFDQSEALNTQESDADNALAPNASNNQVAASANATDKVNAQAKNSASDKDKDAVYQKAVDDTAVALLKDFIKGDNQETAAPTDSGDDGHSVEVSEVQSNNPLKESASGQSSNVNPVNEYSNLTICRVRVQRGSSFNSAANFQPQTEAQSSGISASTQMALESRDLASSDTSLAAAPSALPEAAKSSTTVNAHPSTAPSTGIAANSIRKCRNLGIRSEYEYVNLEAEVNKEQEDVDAQFEIIDHARNDEERLIIDYAPFLGLRRQAKYLFENFKSYEILYYELNRLKTLAQETEQLSLVHYLDFMLDKIAHTIDVDAFLDMSKRQVEIEVFLERDRNPDWCERGDLYSVIEDQVHLIVASKSIKDKYFRLQNLADIATNQGLLFLSGWIWNHQQEYVKFSDQSAKALQAEQGKASAQIQAEAQALAAQAAQTDAAATADAQTAHAAATAAATYAATAASAIASAITAAARNSAMSDETDDKVMGLPSEIAIAQDEAIAKANDRSQKAASMAISANNLRIVGVPGADYEFDDIYADEDLVEEFYDDYFESTFELILEAVYAIVGYKTHYDDINGLTYEDLSPLERQNEQEMKWVTPESIARIAKTWRIIKAASVAGEPLTDSHLAFLSTIEAEYHLSQAVKYAITEARSNKPQEDIDIDTILKDAGLISKSMFNARQEELKERRRMQELLVKSVVEALLKKRMPTMNLEAEFEHLNSLPLSVDKILNLRRYMMLARKYNRRDCFDKAATVLKRAIEKIDIEQPGALQERISSVKINSLNFSNKPVEHADDSKQQSLRKLDSQGLLGQLAVFSGPKTGKMRHSNFTVWNNDSAIILEIQTIKNLSEVQDAVKRAMSLIMTVNNPLAEVLGRSAELVANYKVRRIAVVALLTENGIKLVKAMNLDI